MTSRSHFDSRLVGFKVWCHYSEGVRKKTTDKLLSRGRGRKRNGVEEGQGPAGLSREV